MKKKVEAIIKNPANKKRALCAVAVIVGMFAIMPLTYAADTGDIVTKIVGIILDIFKYIGILLGVWSVGQLILAFKNEDADSKSRAMMMLVVSVSLIGLEALVNATGILSEI